MMPDFEKSFGDFIDRKEYDQAETALFSMVRISFIKGGVARGWGQAAAAAAGVGAITNIISHGYESVNISFKCVVCRLHCRHKG